MSSARDYYDAYWWSCCSFTCVLHPKIILADVVATAAMSSDVAKDLIEGLQPAVSSIWGLAYVKHECAAIIRCVPAWNPSPPLSRERRYIAAVWQEEVGKEKQKRWRACHLWLHGGFYWSLERVRARSCKIGSYPFLCKAPKTQHREKKKKEAKRGKYEREKDLVTLSGELITNTRYSGGVCIRAWRCERRIVW